MAEAAAARRQRQSGSGSGKSGGSDDSSGSGKGGGGKSDDGGSSGAATRTTAASDDGGRSGRGSDDDDAAGDDRWRERGRGGDDPAGGRSRRRPSGRCGDARWGGGGARRRGGGLQVVKIERTAAGVEVVYSNGIKEEIEGGRYELKNPAGRTVVERAATQRGPGRINANVRASRHRAGAVAAGRTLAPPGGRRRARSRSRGNAIEVVYTTGWKEEIEAGRYELKDPNNNTVVQRRATGADRNRLLALAGS